MLLDKLINNSTLQKSPMVIHLPFFFAIAIIFATVKPSDSDLVDVAVRILDEEGRSTAARVRFTNLAGAYFAPEGHAADFAVTQAGAPVSVERDVMMDEERRFAYVNGQFNIELPDEPIRVEIVKGFRYRIYDDTLFLTGRETELDIQLEKWAKLPYEDWYSGDVHVHYICPQLAEEAVASGITTLLGEGVRAAG